VKIKKTKIILKNLNIKPASFKKHKKELKEKGYTIIKNNQFLKKNVKKINTIIYDLISKEKTKAGWEGWEELYKKNKSFEKGAYRLGGLVYKHEIFRKFLLIPEILSLAHDTIKDDIKICSLNFRAPKKNSKDQEIHIDGVPRRKNEGYKGILAMFYLNDSNLNTGATRIIPYTHKKIGWPHNYLNVRKKHSKEKKLFVKAGEIVVLNLNLWHAGSKNISGKKRGTIFMTIQGRNSLQLLNYKKYIPKKIISKLSYEEKYLLAVRNIDKDQVVTRGANIAQLQRDENPKLIYQF